MNNHEKSLDQTELKVFGTDSGFFGESEDEQPEQQKVPQPSSSADDQQKQASQNATAAKGTSQAFGMHSLNFAVAQETQYLHETIRQQKSQIAELEETMRAKDKQLTDMLVGYYKDVLHFKEMKLLSDQGQLTQERQLEVKYFDEKQLLDEQKRQMMNAFIKDVKIQYEKHLGQMQNLIQLLRGELRDREQALEQLIRKMVDPSYLMTQLIEYTNNSPYTLLRLIQDKVGFQHFFSAVESPQPEHGIDYNELDLQIANTYAGERHYKFFKLQFHETLKTYKEKFKTELAALRSEQLTIDLEKQKLESKFVSDLKKIELELKNAHQKQYIDQENKLIEMYEKRIKDLTSAKDFPQNIANIEARNLLEKWYFITKLTIMRERVKKSAKCVECIQLIDSLQKNIDSANYMDMFVGGDIMKDFKAMNEENGGRELQEQRIEYLGTKLLQCESKLTYFQEKCARLNENMILLEKQRQDTEQNNRNLKSQIERAKDAMTRIAYRVGYNEYSSPVNQFFKIEGDAAKTFLNDLEYMHWENKRFVAAQLAGHKSSDQMIQSDIYKLMRDRAVNTRIAGVRKKLGDLEAMSIETFQPEESIWIEATESILRKYAEKEVQTDKMQLKTLKRKKERGQRSAGQLGKDGLEGADGTNAESKERFFKRLFAWKKELDARKDIMASQHVLQERDRWLKIIKETNLHMTKEHEEVTQRTNQMLEAHRRLRKKDLPQASRSVTPKASVTILSDQLTMKNIKQGSFLRGDDHSLHTPKNEGEDRTRNKYTSFVTNKGSKANFQSTPDNLTATPNSQQLETENLQKNLRYNTQQDQRIQRHSIKSQQKIVSNTSTNFRSRSFTPFQQRRHRKLEFQGVLQKNKRARDEDFRIDTQLYDQKQTQIQNSSKDFDYFTSMYQNAVTPITQKRRLQDTSSFKQMFQYRLDNYSDPRKLLKNRNVNHYKTATLLLQVDQELDKIGL